MLRQLATMPQKAFITGVTGQDGAYLADFLLDKGYTVFGGLRRSSTRNTWRLEELGIEDDVEFVTLELSEMESVRRGIEDTRPDEVYNLAAQSFVGTSFDQPLYTTDVNGLGVTRLLEVIRDVDSDIRFYQASTSEMFGNSEESPQNESTRFSPDSPYAASKLYAHSIVQNYRDGYDIHASSGICFNHESPFRGKQFVTRKITNSIASIVAGEQDVLELGNLDSRRDWGFAGDYVKGMWSMLQQDSPGDYVLATGETHSVREFVNEATKAAGIDVRWEGEGVDEVGIDCETGETVVQVNTDFYRPIDVQALYGDASKAREEMGWEPEVGFDGLVEKMVHRDLERVE